VISRKRSLAGWQRTLFDRHRSPYDYAMAELSTIFDASISFDPAMDLEEFLKLARPNGPFICLPMRMISRCSFYP